MYDNFDKPLIWELNYALNCEDYKLNSFTFWLPLASWRLVPTTALYLLLMSTKIIANYFQSTPRSNLRNKIYIPELKFIA